MAETKLYVKLAIWNKLIQALKIRGRGQNESGAFLLGKHESRIVTTFICYDDLYPETYKNGIIEFPAEGYEKLWKYCKQNNLRVLADIHTHPKSWTDQSESDTNNPMIAQKGHIALIAPYFAAKKHQKLNGVGIFEYKGDHEWYVRTRSHNFIKLYYLWPKL
ncbi:MAG: hypothetical protein ACLQQ4_07395 [Bacteroidia bacterium]